GRWWPSVYLDVRELSPGDEQGLGKEVDLYTKGWLPYTLRWRFRVVEQRWPHSLTLEASGDFVGRGVWTLRQDGPWTDVRYEWDVRADKPLLRRFSSLLRPLFAANHRWAMAQGEVSLRLELARRRARTPEERARLPQPPGPTPAWLQPLLAGALVVLGLLALWAFLRARRSRPRPERRARRAGEGVAFEAGFDPDRVAHFEAAGWRAYYERDWLRLLRLLVAMSQEQFRIPFPRSLLAAYYVTRAAAAWAPRDHDAHAVRRHYERFYRLARRYSGLTFDPARVASLELAYNDVHRRLSGRPDGEKGPFLRTMTDLHAALFGLSPARARESARLRVLANNVVDGITSRRSPDAAGDWARLEGYLRDCYRSIRAELHRSGR
ncbi:MAG TPA: hypothetical protein VH257_10485, partial [Chloroflexota bacterium]|nr:hypothetical protein [Chloroflexota bacterium]